MVRSATRLGTLSLESAASALPPRSRPTTRDVAEHGWVVEAVLEIGSETETVFFAVAENTASEAERAVLRYPGILPSDVRVARQVLLAAEISALKLRPGGVRPYGRTPH